MSSLGVVPRALFLPKVPPPCFSGERVSHWLELLVRLWYLINKFQGSACLNLDK